MGLNQTFFPIGYNTPTAQEIINLNKPHFEDLTMKVFGNSPKEFYEFLHFAKKDKNYLPHNYELLKKITLEVNTQLKAGKRIEKRDLKKIYKIIKKCKLAPELPQNHLLDSKTNCTNNSLVLATQSHFFSLFFRNSAFESQNELRYQDLSQKGLHFFTTFFNTGVVKKFDETEIDVMAEVLKKAVEWQVPRLIKRFDEWCTITPNTIMPLYTVAYQTQDPFLLNKLSPHLPLLEEIVDEENYLHVLDFARHVALYELEETCYTFFKKILWDFFNHFTPIPEQGNLFLKYVQERVLSDHCEKEIEKKNKGKEKVDLEMGISKEASIGQAIYYFTHHIQSFDERFLLTLNIPELLLLLILFPEKICSLNFSKFTHDQLEILIPWLPENLKSLNLNHAEISSPHIKLLSRSCPLLENLNFRGCSCEDSSCWLDLSKLTKLKILDIRAKGFKETVLHQIIDSCPDLEELKASVDAPIKPIIHHLSQSARHLKSLVLGQEYPPQHQHMIAEEELKRLAQTHGHQMTNLSIAGGLSPKIVQMFPYLESLTIANPNQLSEIAKSLPVNSNFKKLFFKIYHQNDLPSSDFELLLQKCPYLETLTLVNVVIPDALQDKIGHYCKNLKKFEFINTLTQPSSHLQEIIHKLLEQSSLKKLRLNSQEDISSLLQTHQHLEELKVNWELAFSSLKLTEEQFFPHLTSLSGNFTNFIMNRLGKLFPGLKKLVIKSNASFQFFQLEEVKDRFKKLRILSLPSHNEFINLHLLTNLHTLHFPNNHFFMNDSLSNYLKFKPNVKIYFSDGYLFVNYEILNKAAALSSMFKSIDALQNSHLKITQKKG